MFVARLDGLSADDVVDHISADFIDPYVFGVPPGTSLPLSLPRRIFATWLFLYIGGLLLYLIASSLDYFTIKMIRAARGEKDPLAAKTEISREIRLSVQSLAIMSAMSVPLEIGIQLGYSKVYKNINEHSIAYLCASPILFLLFSDTLIYFIHRGLHHRLIYKHVHKLHHSYVHTTAFAAFAFHPLDGFLQGVPYQLFVFCFPFYSIAHLVSLSVVLLWTINIHDRMSMGIPGVNCAAHHTIHHTTFRSNYGQYFTFWDRVFSTHRDPHVWAASGSPTLTEKEAYGKDA